jgi:hypothetical protein
MALNAICCCLGGREAAPTAAHYVSLDHQRRAQSCTVSNTLVSGEGCVLGSAAILQDRSFWSAAPLHLYRVHPLASSLQTDWALYTGRRT